MDIETTWATKQVEDIETVIMHKQEDLRNAGNAGSTTRKPQKTFEEMFNGIADCLSNVTCSENEEDGEDEAHDEDDTEVVQLSEDHQPGWMMGKISKPVQHLMEKCQQKQMRADKVMQPGWGDSADFFRK